MELSAKQALWCKFLNQIYAPVLCKHSNNSYSTPTWILGTKLLPVDYGKIGLKKISVQGKTDSMSSLVVGKQICGAYANVCFFY